MSPVDWTIEPNGPLEPNVIVASHLPEGVEGADLKDYLDEAVNDGGSSRIEVTMWTRRRALVRFADHTEQSFDAGLFAHVGIYLNNNETISDFGSSAQNNRWKQRNVGLIITEL